MSGYDDLKAKGVDMSWYDRALQRKGLRNPHNVPLHDDRCSRLSIYLLKADGTLWTLDGGKPYAQVRNTGKPQKKNTFVCARCKEQFTNTGAAYAHYGETK